MDAADCFSAGTGAAGGEGVLGPADDGVLGLVSAVELGLTGVMGWRDAVWWISWTRGRGDLIGVSTIKSMGTDLFREMALGGGAISCPVSLLMSLSAWLGVPNAGETGCSCTLAWGRFVWTKEDCAVWLLA